MKTDKPYDNEYLNRVIENEGTEYGIVGYLGKLKEGDCDDPKSIELWNAAYDAIKNIEKHLDKDYEDQF
jgi:hypothetical protein